MRQKYCAWREEAAKNFKTFYRHWADLIFQLETGDKIMDGDNILDQTAIVWEVCAAGGNVRRA